MVIGSASPYGTCRFVQESPIRYISGRRSGISVGTDVIWILIVISTSSKFALRNSIVTVYVPGFSFDELIGMP